VPKHLGKVNGEPTFGGLHTVTNEYGEVRAMTLTATKAHDQFMPALARIPQSLHKYGHQDVQLVFTDNVRGDKAALEHVFPSLLCDVHPVRTSTLPPIALPAGCVPIILGSPFQVNARLNSLMETLGAYPPNSNMHVAMDMEWSVDLVNGIQGRVALIQIAYRTSIYLILVRCLRLCSPSLS
jgi:hypothetical protein